MKMSTWAVLPLMLAVMTHGMDGPAAAADEPKTPHIVFVTGDDEYRSEITMPMIARILEERHGMRCSIAYAADPETGRKNPKHNTNIEGLEALADADLAVFYLRWRTLPDEQVRAIVDFAQSGKPMIGLRTTTHSFRYPGDSPWAEWNDGFGRDIFGQRWITHHGHRSTTVVSVIPEAANHPVLEGVEREFECRSWLYHVAPLHGDAKPLLIGRAVDSDKTGQQDRFPLTQPVAWTKTYEGARVFFTTLGHPKDFENESMRRLLINAVYWGLDRKIPAGGADAELVGEYVAPPTH